MADKEYILPGSRPRSAHILFIMIMTGAILPLPLRAEATNAVPVAANANYVMEPGERLEIVLEATDEDSDTLTYIITALPAKGTVSVGSTALAKTNLPYAIPDGDNTLSYLADANDSATNTLKFKADDGTDTSTVATVSIVVNLPPQPQETIFYTTPNGDLEIELPVTDSANDTLTYTITSLPGHGRIMIGKTALADENLPYATEKSGPNYTPDEDYHGHDEFTFTASDGRCETDTITVNIEVNTTPVANALDVTVLPNGKTVIELNGVDADRDPVQYIIASLPAHGMLVADGSNITENDLPLVLEQGLAGVEYTVATDYRGTDGFHYRAEDAVSTSPRAAVKITVNTPPVAANGILMAPAGQSAETLLAPSDADGDALTIRFPQLPEKGALSVGGRAVDSTESIYEVPATGLAVTYTPTVQTTTQPAEDATTDAAGGTAARPTTARSPAAKQIDQDSFTWVANDGHEDSPTAAVSVYITDDSDSSENDSTAGEDVLSDTPEVPKNCGATGSAEAAVLSVLLFIAPARRFFRKRPPGDRF